jgi:hypothetical protein
METRGWVDRESSLYMYAFLTILLLGFQNFVFSLFSTKARSRHKALKGKPHEIMPNKIILMGRAEALSVTGLYSKLRIY